MGFVFDISIQDCNDSGSVERKIHMAQNQYQCEVCGAILENEAALQEHQRKMHPQFGCEICGETFSSESELENHKRAEHPEQTPTT